MLNRRRFLAVPAAVAIATSPACAATKDTIAIALSARAPATVDPSATTLGADNWACSQIFDNLVAPDPGTFAMTPADFRPALAESWSSSSDARSWIFKLRRGAQFHKGYGEMTSEDVAFT